MTSPSDPPPRRRFVPEPVETVSRSSKRRHPGSPNPSVGEEKDKDTASEAMTTATTVKPRKFLPQPVEQTKKTSRKKNADLVGESGTSSGASHDVSAGNTGESDQPISKTPARRFAPEPVESTTRSSRRKFAPEPVETSTRSSKDTPSTDKPRRKFAPEPVETTTVRRRGKPQDDESNESPDESLSDTSSRASSRRSSGGRKFSPELIETAKGSYRRGPRSSTSSTSPSSPPPVPDAAATDSETDVPEVPESRFSAAALQKRNHEEQRRHSYCVPNLPIIESDSSEEDSPTPSLTNTPSTTTDADHNSLGNITEKGETSYVDYVLGLSESNRRKLQEQAMSAYINERTHEPVNHFAVEEEDEEPHGILSANNGADPQTFRRSSQGDHELEMDLMRRHHEQLEEAKRGLQEDTAGASRFSAAALAARHHLGQVHKPKKPKDEESEFLRMRKAASPPMLGEDIVFPYTISPRMTRCDVDQAPRPRRADSDNDDEKMSVDAEPGLWSTNVGVSNRSSVGLWMGLCQKGSGDQSRPTTPARDGIQTPMWEAANPFESATPGRATRTPGTRTPARRLGPKQWNGGMILTPMTPPRTADGQDDFTSSIDRKLRLEAQIEEQFPNQVITQIYNYLSLGYPSLARPFDEELSKISRITIEDLRKGDWSEEGTIRGYVGAPEGEGDAEEDETGVVKGCKRWEALRLYVKEWARQSPNFAVDQTVTSGEDANIKALKNARGQMWGATVRKGSWAN